MEGPKSSANHTMTGHYSTNRSDKKTTTASMHSGYATVLVNSKTRFHAICLLTQVYKEMHALEQLPSFYLNRFYSLGLVTKVGNDLFDIMDD